MAALRVHNRSVRKPALFLLALAATVLAQPSFLLPDDVTPKKHIIELTIDPAQDTFTGWSRIEVDLAKSTKTLWINAKDLTPQQSSVTYQGNTLQATATPTGGEFIAVELPQQIGPGPATISIHYQGKLEGTAIAGPYRNKVANDW